MLILKLKMVGRPKTFKNQKLVQRCIMIGEKQELLLKQSYIGLGRFMRWCIDKFEKGELKYEENNNKSN